MLTGNDTYDFTVDGLPTGPYVALIRRKGSGSFTQRITLHPGEVKDLGLLDLKKASLEVKVMEKGSEQSLVGVRILPLEGMWSGEPIFLACT